jgi:hypothetical protein
MSSATTTAAPPPKPPRGAIPGGDEQFGRAFKWSLIAHGGFALFVIIQGIVFPSKPMNYIPSLRVDLVGLPDVLKKDKAKLMKIPDLSDLNKDLREAEQQAKQIKPKDAPKVDMTETADPDEMVLKPTTKPGDRKKRMQSALDRIKSLSKISDDPQEAQAVAIKGNKLSKGTSLTDGKESDEASYTDLLRDRLQENWALPVWLARQDLSAQVMIFIDAKGKLKSFKFVKTSGNAQFDEEVKRTLQQTVYPIPPANLAGALASSGVTVGFPL